MSSQEGAELLRWLFGFDHCADYPRYAAMPHPSYLERNAQVASVLICIVCSVERHKSEVQVKGMA